MRLLRIKVRRPLARVGGGGGAGASVDGDWTVLFPHVITEGKHRHTRREPSRSTTISRHTQCSCLLAQASDELEVCQENAAKPLFASFTVSMLSATQCITSSLSESLCRRVSCKYLLTIR